MMSSPTDVLNDTLVCYQDLLEYVGLENIKRGFPGEPALKKHYKTFFELQLPLALQKRKNYKKVHIIQKDCYANYLSYDTL